MFALLDWESNQHMDFKKSNRYVSVYSLILLDIKETNKLLYDINSKSLYHPKILGSVKLPISKSGIKMFYSNSSLLVPIHATKIQKNIRKYLIFNTCIQVLREYLNNVNNDTIKDIITIVFNFL